LQNAHTGLQVALCPARFSWQSPTWQLLKAPPEITFDLAETVDEHAWQGALNTLTQATFEGAGDPLVRFKLIHNPATSTCDILLGFHHALMDGAGAWHLMQSFTRACWLKQHVSQPTCTPDPQAKIRFFQPENKTLSANEACSPQAASRVGLNTLADSFKNKLTHPSTHVSQAKDSKGDATAGLMFSRVTLASDTVTALLAKCRHEGANLNSAITALALTCSRQLFKSYWPGITPIQYLTPISLRQRIPNWRIEDLGVCVTTTNHLKLLKSDSPKDFWQHAKAYKDALHNTITSGTPEATFHLLENIKKPARKDNLIFAHMPKNYLLINNLGKLDTPETQNGFEYQALSWATHQEPNAAIVQFYVATIGGTLSLTVQSSRLSQVQVDVLSSEMKKQLLSLAEDS
jgi:NRPS condensation-like uncharacterized protein